MHEHTLAFGQAEVTQRSGALNIPKNRTADLGIEKYSRLDSPRYKPNTPLVRIVSFAI